MQLLRDNCGYDALLSSSASLPSFPLLRARVPEFFLGGGRAGGGPLKFGPRKSNTYSATRVFRCPLPPQISLMSSEQCNPLVKYTLAFPKIFLL